MYNFEKDFQVIESNEIGVTVKKHYYGGNNLAYFYGISIMNDNRININFEGHYSTRFFATKKERDDFINFFYQKLKEAHGHVR